MHSSTYWWGCSESWLGHIHGVPRQKILSFKHTNFYADFANWIWFTKQPGLHHLDYLHHILEFLIYIFLEHYDNICTERFSLNHRQLRDMIRTHYAEAKVYYFFTKQPGWDCLHHLDYLHHILVLDNGEIFVPGLDCLHHLDYLHQVLGLHDFCQFLPFIFFLNMIANTFMERFWFTLCISRFALIL